jgi:hypothetical protein
VCRLQLCLRPLNWPICSSRCSLPLAWSTCESILETPLLRHSISSAIRTHIRSRQSTGVRGDLFIVQARPETVHSAKPRTAPAEMFHLIREPGPALLAGQALPSNPSMWASEMENSGIFPKRAGFPPLQNAARSAPPTAMSRHEICVCQVVTPAFARAMPGSGTFRENRSARFGGSPRLSLEMK